MEEVKFGQNIIQWVIIIPRGLSVKDWGPSIDSQRSRYNFFMMERESWVSRPNTPALKFSIVQGHLF